MQKKRAKKKSMTRVLEEKSLREVRDGWCDWRVVNASRGISSTPLLPNDCFSGSKKKENRGRDKKLVGGSYAAHRQPAHHVNHQRAPHSTWVCRNASCSAAQGSARRWRGLKKGHEKRRKSVHKCCSSAALSALSPLACTPPRVTREL